MGDGHLGVRRKAKRHADFVNQEVFVSVWIVEQHYFIETAPSPAHLNEPSGATILGTSFTAMK